MQGGPGFRNFLRHSEHTLYVRVAGFFAATFPILYVAGSAVADSAAILVSLMFLFHSTRTKDWRWLKSSWVVLVAVLWGYMLLRAGLAERPDKALARAGAWIRYPLFAAALAFWILHFKPVQRQLFISLAVTVLFLLFDSLIQYNLGTDLFGREVIPTEEGSMRLTGPFSGPKVGIILAWISFPVIAMLVIPPSAGERNRRKQMVGALCAVLFLIVVFLSGERMALLLSLFGCALLMILSPAIRREMLLLLVAAVLAVGVVAQYNPSLMIRQYYSTVKTISEYKDSPYGQIWQSSMAIIEAHPVAGVGAKHFRYLCPRPEYGSMETVDVRCNLHPHHLYLEWLVEGGAIALLGFLAVLAALARDIVRPVRTLIHHPLYVGLLVAIILRIWPLSTATSFHAAWSALPFWLMVGWILAIAYTYRDKAKET